MKKKYLFLILLILLVLLIALYIVFTPEKTDYYLKLEESIAKESKVNVVINASDYKKEILPILNSYLDLLENNSFSEENILNLKTNILEIKVPKNYKELHLNIILALERMEEFIKTENEEDKISSVNLLNEAKKKLEE